MDGNESKGDLPKGFEQQLRLLTGSTVYVDPDGDLELVVGSGGAVATFCVSSKVMRLMSPVWRAMLRVDCGTYPSGLYMPKLLHLPITMSTQSTIRRLTQHLEGFKESSIGEHQITFPEDDTVAFFVVLLASYLRFQQVPRNLEFRYLLKLCILCDKYDCLSVIQPWITSWLYPHTADLYDTGLAEDWIVVAQILGKEELLVRAAYRLLRVCKTDSLQRCLIPKLECIDNTPTELAGQYTLC